MNILILTPLYPADDTLSTNTPIVHYFTREWVKMGCRVVVAHYQSAFPKFVYWFGKYFKRQIEKRVGFIIPPHALAEKEFTNEGVEVKRFILHKLRPHSRYGKTEITKAVDNTVQYCKSIHFRPDVIAFHWLNPQMEIAHFLKQYFNVPLCYVVHDGIGDFATIYKNECDMFLNDIDVIGYRSRAIKREFENKVKIKSNYFMCYSGIPQEFLMKNEYRKHFEECNSILYVGTLIARKYPTEILKAAAKAFIGQNFSVRFVGVGSEKCKLENYIQKNSLEDNVVLYGKVSRDKVVELMRKTEIFAMISKNETYGLVYLEAMAAGCITIASRDEGFDGIIENGVNGFLCEAGNVEELITILNYIQHLSKNDLLRISMNAINTAKKLTDFEVAKIYLNSLCSVVK